jgi:hypothetical protein
MLHRFRVLALLLVAIAGLYACGGGGGSSGGAAAPQPNQAPTTNAGADQSVDEGVAVNLSGTGADSDGTIASYGWQQDSGTVVVITNANMANASFTAPIVAASEDLVFRLTVTDNDGATASDTVTVTVNDVSPPVTNLTWDQGNWDELNWQ